MDKILKSYPIDTFSGTTREELEIAISQAYNKGRKEAIDEVLEIIEANKEEVRKDTGAFKYDFCFDLIKEAIYETNKKEIKEANKNTL
jgi:hypothetical protein